jgi:hypothetical protein
MSRVHFMSGVNDGQAGVQACLEDRIDMRAMQAEQPIHSRVTEGSDHELAARNQHYF